MSVKRGTADIVAIKRGTTNIIKVMRGIVQVWPTGTAPTAPTIVATTRNGSSFDGVTPRTTAVLPIPGTPQAGDVLLLFSQTFDNTPSTATAPSFVNVSGPTSSSEPQDMQILKRQMVGGESGSITVTWDKNTWNNAFLMLLRGVSYAGIVASIAVGGPGTLVTFPNLTAPSANSRQISLWSGYDLTPSGQPTGHTQVAADWVSGSGGGAVQNGTAVQSAAGASGVITGTLSGSDTWCALLAIVPGL